MFFPVSKSFDLTEAKENSTSTEYQKLYKEGYLQNYKEDFNGYITEDDVLLSLCNVPQVIFEVTSACNLRCEYCCYGYGYETFKNRTQGNLKFDTAKTIIDFLLKKMGGSNNTSTQTPFVISFYGGEPLLNIDVIQQIVDYSKGLSIPNRILNFSMTTNATKLADNIEFLERNKFHILVSLDGNKATNQHRKMANGKESYDLVMNNLRIVKEKYPDFFKTIRFNAVFSNTSDIDSVLSFFKETFEVVPTISLLHEPDANAPGYDSIKKMIKPVGLPTNEIFENEAIIQIPLHKRIADFLFKLTHNYYTSELDLLLNQSSAHYPTATCIPFSRRIFVTTQGDLLPCEKICRDNPFGKIRNKKVEINCKEVAQRHNNLTHKYSQICHNCYLQMCCNQCAYNFKQKRCSSFKNKEQFKKILSEIFTYMELHPEINDIIENNIILR